MLPDLSQTWVRPGSDLLPLHAQRHSGKFTSQAKTDLANTASVARAHKHVLSRLLVVRRLLVHHLGRVEEVVWTRSTVAPARCVSAAVPTR